MIRFLLLTTLAAVLVASALAQPDPAVQGNPPPPQPGAAQRGNNRMGMAGMQGMQQEALMEVTPQGVFVLRAGILAKFDPQTLTPQGTLELFAPVPAQPTMPQNPTAQDRQVMRDWMMAMMPRMAPAIMLLNGDMLLIVQGNNFFRVNQQTLKLEAAQTALAKPDANNPRQMMMAKPELRLVDNTLYILMDDQLVSVNIGDGAVLSRGVLPKEMMAQMQMPAGMMGGGAAGAGRGAGAGRAGRGNAAPGNQPQQ